MKDNSSQLYLQFVDAHKTISDGYKKLAEVTEKMTTGHVLDESTHACVESLKSQEPVVRARIRRLVQWMALREGVEFREVWAKAYDKLGEDTDFFPALEQRPRESLLETTQRKGLLDKLLTIVETFFTRGLPA